ncbi:MAG: aspartate aminotransferase family protein [Thermoplasmatota archaeon]
MNDESPPWDDVMLPNYGTLTLCLVEGRGAWVTDDAGRRYLDLLSGIAVTSLGHRHPAVEQAARDQMGRLWHTSNLFANQPALELAAALRQAVGGHHKALLVNSGTEANEAVLKLVRRHAEATGRPDGVILAFEGGFHGRTTGALALTGQAKHRYGFGPLPGQIVHVAPTLEAVEAAFQDHDVVGLFAEFVQGEGGVRPLPTDLARRLRQLCDDHDALLVADEVQTGLGRTGRLFAYQHHGAAPHVVTLAKSLGNGLPIGACLVHDDHAALLEPGSHGCTFGGNPVAAAAALAVLETLEREHLCERADHLGAMAMTMLAGAGVRGQGLLLGVPVEDPHAVQAAMRQQGYLVGVAGDAVRLAPPLTIVEADWHKALQALAEVLKIEPGERRRPDRPVMRAWPLVPAGH